MLKHLSSQLGKHPVEVLAGILLVVLGVVLTVAGAGPDGPPHLLYLGSLGTAFGGVVLSWTVGKAVSREEALQEVGSQLGLVSNTLGQAAGQMSRVVDQCADHSMPADTGFALVGQSATLVGAQVAVIQSILGKPFEAGDLLATLAEMENLAEKLDRRDKREAGEASDAPEVIEVKSRLQELRAELTGLGITRGRVDEVSKCPTCGKDTNVSLGVHPGDTAAAICRHCRSRFNVHRRSDGSVFSRAMGASPNGAAAPRGSVEGVVAVEHPCPKCSREVRVLVRADDGPRKFAVCLHCGASVIFDLKNDTVTSDGAFAKTVGVPIGRYGSGGSGARPIVACADCGREMRAVIRTAEAHFAIDNTCRRLYVVTNAEFLTWRQAHEPDSICYTEEDDQA